MTREDYINNKFLTVVGRAHTIDDFAMSIKKVLFDNFDIAAIHGLDDFGIDDKERYLAFVTGQSMHGRTFTAQKIRFQKAQFGAHLHQNLEEAFDFSKEEYPAFGEAELERQMKYEELSEKFPPIKAKEIEQFEILESLMESGKIKYVRASLNDDPCVVLLAITMASDEIRVRPFAVMMNEDIEAKLDFPNPEED